MYSRKRWGTKIQELKKSRRKTISYKALTLILTLEVEKSLTKPMKRQVCSQQDPMPWQWALQVWALVDIVSILACKIPWAEEPGSLSSVKLYYLIFNVDIIKIGKTDKCGSLMLALSNFYFRSCKMWKAFEWLHISISIYPYAWVCIIYVLICVYELKFTVISQLKVIIHNFFVPPY